MDEAEKNSLDEAKRPQFQFGTRHLSDPQNVFEHNAWDNVQWGEEQIKIAEEKRKHNSSSFLPEEEATKYEIEASNYWDTFYGMHENKFFKERHWIFIELPELANSQPSNCSREASSTEEHPGSSSGFRVLEVGCGTGSTVFPLLEANTLKDRGGYVYCCDFSSKAIELVKANPNYDATRCHAFVCDVSAENVQFPFPEGSLDVILLIFVMSAVSPERIGPAIKRLSRHLKPGGRIFFRDYGQYDMAELRFKPGRCISEHFYVRGDGTRVYFFGQDELRTLFESAGLVEEQNIVDRRLLVNRGRQLTMFRVWIQCKYRKPE